MLCGINYFFNTDILEINQVCAKPTVCIFCSFKIFQGPESTNRPCQPCPALPGPPPSLPVGPGPHLSSAWGSLSLLKLFCNCVYLQSFLWPHLLLLMGSPLLTMDLDLGLLVDPASSPQLCPPCSALVGLCALGEGRACTGSPSVLMSLGSSQPLLLHDIRF